MTIKPGEQVELRALGGIAQARRWFQIIDRLALGPKPGALVNTGEKACAPIARVPLRQTAIERIAHHDERRQVAALAAEAVGRP
jgi:hypothetical protein